MTNRRAVTVTVWSYHADGRPAMSGISPGDVDEALRRLERDGHFILTDGRYQRPSNHHVIGSGIGHDDAEFAESGRSMAAYYENGEAHGGRWWEDTDDPFSTGVKDYGCADRSRYGRIGGRTTKSEALARQAS